MYIFLSAIAWVWLLRTITLPPLLTIAKSVGRVSWYALSDYGCLTIILCWTVRRAAPTDLIPAINQNLVFSILTNCHCVTFFTCGNKANKIFFFFKWFVEAVYHLQTDLPSLCHRIIPDIFTTTKDIDKKLVYRYRYHFQIIQSFVKWMIFFSG